jgi:hypothetical protein
MIKQALAVFFVFLGLTSPVAAQEHEEYTQAQSLANPLLEALAYTAESLGWSQPETALESLQVLVATAQLIHLQKRPPKALQNGENESAPAPVFTGLGPGA